MVTGSSPHLCKEGGDSEVGGFRLPKARESSNAIPQDSPVSHLSPVNPAKQRKNPVSSYKASKPNIRTSNKLFQVL